MRKPDVEGREGQQPVDWQEVSFSFYLGSEIYPYEITYRSSEERLQVRVEKRILLRKVVDTNTYEAPAGSTRDFLDRFEDCSFSLQDGYFVRDGFSMPPSLWLFGWQEVTTPEERQQYEQDKAASSLSEG